VSVPCFHGVDGTACSTDEFPDNQALRRLSSFDRPKPTVTKEPTRRISRLDDESPSQPANPTHYRPDATDSSLRHNRYDGAAMLPSPRLTIRPLREQGMCSLKPTVFRHTPAALPHLDVVGARPPAPKGEWVELRPFPGNLLAGTRRRKTSGTGEHTSWVLAGEPTNGFPASSSASIVALLARGGCGASAEATSRDRRSAFTNLPLRGELARPPTDAPRWVDRTETLLSSEKIPRRDSDTACLDGCVRP
jgi:hypothetical protein